MKDNSSITKLIDLTCTTALYEKEVNFYELDFPTNSKKPSCILLDNSGLSKERSKVSHADQNLDGCISYINSQNNEENKVEQIFERNRGDWKFAKIITITQKNPIGENKQYKIRKLFLAKYDEAKRKKQIPMASALADEVNYEFDMNVITDRMAETYIKILSEENIDIDLFLEYGTKIFRSKVGNKRKGNDESNPNKNGKILLNAPLNSNHTKKPSEFGTVFPGHLSKGKQVDLRDKHPEHVSGSIHGMNIDDDDEYFTLLNSLDYSHDEYAKSLTQAINGDTSVKAPDYFIGESQFNDNNIDIGSNSLGSHNELITNEDDGLTEEDLNFLLNDEEAQDMNLINSPTRTSNSSD